MIGFGGRRIVSGCLVRSLGCSPRYVTIILSKSGHDFLVYYANIHPQVLIGTIRKEIASCSEKAYPSIPISDAKSLLFLDSEGSVVKFAQELGWVVKDGRIYFPVQDDDASRDSMVTSDQVIENALGYARELETIV